MGTYKEYIKSLKDEFIGRLVKYDDEVYKIVDVDYNGLIHINKPSKWNKTTAVYGAAEARKALLNEEVKI